MPKLRMLCVGELENREFRGPLAWLVERYDITLVRCLQVAQQRIGEGRVPDVVVLAQARPDQFSPAEFAKLQQRLPEARWITLLGAWCDAEGRSGHPLPNTTRISCRHFADRIETVLGPEPSCQELPLAAVPRPRRELVAIRTTSLECFDTLADGLFHFGLPSYRLERDSALQARGVSLVIWDATHGVQRDLEALGRLAAYVQPTPVVVISGFLRQHDHEAALAQGAAATFCKPFQVADLVRRVERLLGDHRKLLQGSVA